MMPLIVRDFSWHQTADMISLVVNIKGIKADKTDVLTSKNYIRIHYHPFIFEAFPLSEVDDMRGKCTIDEGSSVVLIQLPKANVGQEWPTLEDKALDRMAKKIIRESAVSLSHKRHEESTKLRATKRYEQKQLSVQEQIRLDDEERQRIAAIKRAETNKALTDLSEWEQTNTLQQGEAGELGIPRIRQEAHISVKFTPRQFLTPSRESTAVDEQEWLKKQAEARRRSGFNDDDLRPEERDPSWLLDKGLSLMNTECHLGAISAFTLGIKLAPKLPELYMERAAAHLSLRNFAKCVEDASQALELLTPKVVGNMPERIRSHVIRGSAFRDLKMRKEAVLDFKEAVRLNPEDLEVFKTLDELEGNIERKEMNVSSSDED